MKLDDLRLYHLVVESRSFTKAAELAELPITNVSRRIKALEQQLQVTLLARTTRQLRPTEAGLSFYQSSKETLQQFDLSIEQLHHNQRELQGKLRIQVFSGSAVVLPTIIEFQRKHPKVLVDLVTSERQVDLVENNFDVGMRLGPQRDSSLIGRRVGRVAYAVVASSKYVEQNGRPRQPDDLLNHNCLRFRMPTGRVLSEWAISDDRRPQVSGNLIVNDLNSYQQLIVQGCGVGYLPLLLAKPLVEKGELIELFPPNYQAGEEVWLVYPNMDQRSQLVVRFVEHLLEQLEHDALLQILKLR